MALGDIFKINEYKKDIESLTAKNKELNNLVQEKLSIKQMKPIELEELIQKRQSELDNTTLETETANNEIARLSEKITELIKTRDNIKSQIIDLDDQTEIESFGLYKPKYNFATALEYKDELTNLRKEQKESIKNGVAAKIFMPISFNNSASKGRSIQKKNIRQLLRSFNVECEAAINKVTYSNFERVKLRITKSFDQLNKLNNGNGIQLTDKYLNLKLNELHLAFEYADKKQSEKEELREQRSREREEKALQKELAIKRKKIDKDLNHFENLQKELEHKLELEKNKSEIEKLKSDLLELKKNIEKINKDKKDLDFRETNATAGYVYIISNIGSFSKDVVKIGVTRRLNPMERVEELGSASVPFKFDVHALIFSYDAYKLEAKLHERFARNRINKVNKRKEYFKISIGEIEKELQKYKDLTIDFKEIPEATEYRETLKIDSANNS